MHVLHIVGARPNFVKASPVVRALEARNGFRQTLVHTGQHYDSSMSAVFFEQLGMPEPDVNLGVGSASHARQTGEVMIRLEPIVLQRNPDLVLVYGDVNSTLAAALVCSKLGVPVGHVEAGLRSFDRSMPEEINRQLTDHISHLLFTPSEDGDRNLVQEGIAPERIHRVGNVMIDTLVRLLPSIEQERRGDLPSRYALVTLHRPSNVDEEATLRKIFSCLLEVSRELPVIFPVHPRTRKHLGVLGLQVLDRGGLRLEDPAPYLQFLALLRTATVIITDSGGIQEEATYLGVPCVTLRKNTERPITETMGTNVVVGEDLVRLRDEVSRVIAGQGKKGRIPPLWDGKAAERIVDVLARPRLVASLRRL
ncbi:MAG: non-hydrolyzing UDP-N-acetylglucosamine 2-epimerase [Terriglobales bacterium]